MQVKIYFQREIRDKNGVLLKRSRRKLCRSLNKQFAQLLRVHLDHPSAAVPGTTELIRDILNATNTHGTSNQPDYYVMAMQGPAASNGYGIIVGTDATAVTAIQYVLLAPVAHGVGAGQLSYGATSSTAVTVAGAISSFTFNRVFTGNAVGAVVVQEVGWYVLSRDTTGNGRTIMPLRDLTGGDSVPALGTYTIVFTVSVTV